MCELTGITTALSIDAPARSGDNTSLDGRYYMKEHTHDQSDEPVGIVISCGWEPETTPRFSAYVWAPGPEDETEPDVQAA